MVRSGDQHGGPFPVPEFPHFTLEPSAQICRFCFSKEICMSKRFCVRKRATAALTILAIVGWLAAIGGAQSFRGSILGVVSDSSGAVVGGAQVLVTNAATGLSRDTVTSADGSYLVPELPVGTYSVRVTMASFQVSVTSGVRVVVASQKRVDVVLKPGALTQTVEVSA